MSGLDVKFNPEKGTCITPTYLFADIEALLKSTDENHRLSLDEMPETFFVYFLEDLTVDAAGKNTATIARVYKVQRDLDGRFTTERMASTLN